MFGTIIKSERGIEIDVALAKTRNVQLICGHSVTNGVLIKFASCEETFVVSTANGIFGFNDQILTKQGHLQIVTFTGTVIEWIQILKGKEINDYFTDDCVLIEVKCPESIVPYTALSVPLIGLYLTNVAKLPDEVYRLINGLVFREQRNHASLQAFLPDGTSGLGLLDSQYNVVALVADTHQAAVGKIVPIRCVDHLIAYFCELKSSHRSITNVQVFAKADEAKGNKIVRGLRLHKHSSRRTAKSIWIRNGVEVEEEFEF